MGKYEKTPHKPHGYRIGYNSIQIIFTFITFSYRMKNLDFMRFFVFQFS